MPRNVTVTFADGAQHTYEGVPDGATPYEVQTRAEKQFAKTVKGIDGGAAAAQAAPAPAAGQPGYLATVGGGIGKGIGDVALGAQRLIGRGLQGLGASAPGDWMVNDADAGKARMAQEFAPYKAANPWTGAGSELAGNIIATLPVGGALGAGAKALGAGAPVVSGLSSGGFTLGGKVAPTGNAIVDAAANLGLRSATGGAVGGASAALVDPEHVGTGAAIGAALPPVLKGLGASGMWVVDKYRQLAVKGDVKGAAELVRALGNGSPSEVAALGAQLRAAPTLVEGGAPTVAQALQTPQASVMEKTVFDAANPASALHTKLRVTQPAARAAALDSVAPTDASGIATARADFGNALTSRVIPEERGVSKLVSAQYQSIPKAGASDVNLPVQDMQSAVDKYLGRGAFGENTQPATAVATARKLSAPGGAQPASLVVDSNGAPWRAAIEATPQPAKWAEVSQLRSSLNEAISKARFAGDKQAEAAMLAQKKAIDGAIESDLSPSALAAWKEANASHAAKMGRFHTGPQRDIFMTAADGQPVVQSGAVSGKFWNGGGAADKDVQSFRRLIDDNPAMLGQFRSMITTEGLGREAGRNAPVLGDNFVKWVQQRLPSLTASVLREMSCAIR